MKKILAIFFVLSAFSIKANACEFSWFHYGDGNSGSFDLIDKNIGEHIPDKFCKYARKYEIVIQSDSARHGNSCIGYAFVSLRKIGTRIQQNQATDYVQYDPNCGGQSGQIRLEASAALTAVDIMMDGLENYKVIEK